jgi:hypothetical protein
VPKKYERRPNPRGFKTYWCWRSSALLVEMGHHEALGLSEDQFYDQTLAGTSKSAALIREAIQKYRDDHANGTGFYSEAAE